MFRVKVWGTVGFVEGSGFRVKACCCTVDFGVGGRLRVKAWGIVGFVESGGFRVNAWVIVGFVVGGGFRVNSC